MIKISLHNVVIGGDSNP